jgi:hypothetical protein
MILWQAVKSMQFSSNSKVYDMQLGMALYRLESRPELLEQVKFFVAKPLIASNGYHMGSL